MTDAPLSDWLKAVVFDLDGTLVDSAPDIGSALNKTMEADKLGPYSLPEVRGFIGHGIRRLVERAYDERRMPLSGQALDDKVDLEDSVFLAGNDGPRRTAQIVIHQDARQTGSVRWSFARSNSSPSQTSARRNARREPELPL